MTSVELKNVSYLYSKDTPFEKLAVDGVDITFEQGLITGIIGHTGSGKSTISQMINGLLKPSSGEVYLSGKNIWEEPKKIKSVRFTAGLVFQYPEYQLFEETVRADIGFGPKNMGLSEEEINERVMFASRFTGVEESWLDKSPFDLSGGQKRRVAIAGIIAMKPSVLILDEPAAGLDPRGREDILRRVSEYRNETGSTVIIISHSMEDMARYCDRLVVMNKGRVYKYGTPSEIFKDAEKITEIGLSVPQVTRLLIELKKLGYDVNTSLYTVEDAEKEIKRLIGGGSDAG